MTNKEEIEAIYNRYDLTVLRVISVKPANFIKKEKTIDKKKSDNDTEGFQELLDIEIKKLTKK